VWLQADSVYGLWIAGVGKLFIPQKASQCITFLYIIIVAMATLIGTSLATATTRDWVCRYFKFIKI
jgi:hypothetical protein